MPKQRLIEIDKELKDELLWALEVVEHSFCDSLSMHADAFPDLHAQDDQEDEHWLDWLGVIMDRLKTGIALTERELRTCVRLIKEDEVYNDPWCGPNGPAFWVEKHKEHQARARSVVTFCEAAWENARRREQMAKERQQSPLTEAG